VRVAQPALTIILIAAVAALPPNVMPVLSRLLSDTHGLDEAQLGYFIASGTLAGLLASASAPFWITRVRIGMRARALVIGCLLGYGLGVHALAVVDGPPMLYALQFLLGGSTILVASTCVHHLMLQPNPARMMSLKIAGDVVVASAFLFLMPLSSLPLPGFLAALSACFVAGALFAWRWPRSRTDSQPAIRVTGPAAPATLATAPASAWTVLAMMAVFYVAGVSGWNYLGRLAAHAGLDAGAGATAIAIGLFGGIVGAIGAASLAGRGDRVWPQAVAGSAFVASILALGHATSFASYLVAVLVFNIAWNFFIPFVMALLATRDGSGRLSTLTPATAMVGGIVGPPLTGNLMQATSYETAMLVLAMTAALSVTAYVIAVRRQRRQRHTSAWSPGAKVDGGRSERAIDEHPDRDARVESVETGKRVHAPRTGSHADGEAQA